MPLLFLKKDYDARIAKAFTEGYNLGHKAGLQDGLMAKITPNELRKYLGLSPLKGE